MDAKINFSSKNQKIEKEFLGNTSSPFGCDKKK